MTTRKSIIVMLVQANVLQFSIPYGCFVIKKYKYWARTLFHMATYDTFYLFISSSFHFTS